MSTTTTTQPINWFEVGVADADKAKSFYGGLFGWTFAPFEDDPSYSIVDCGNGAPMQGGLFGTEGRLPSYAVVFVQVPDVAATCEQAEALGGSVVVPPQSAPNGLVFAHIGDVEGNRLGVYTPPAAA